MAKPLEEAEAENVAPFCRVVLKSGPFRIHFQQT